MALLRLLCRNTSKVREFSRIRKGNFDFVRQAKVRFSDKPPEKDDSKTVFNIATPSALDKVFLVWTKKYKSMDEIPKIVPAAEITNAWERSRIKIANIMMVGTAIGCVYYAMRGREAKSRGESLHKMNLDWHKEMNAKLEAEEKRKLQEKQ